MVQKILSLILAVALMASVSACSSDKNHRSGVGGNAMEDGSIDILNRPLPEHVAGTQEALVAEVGDRVFFDFDSAEVNSTGQRILQRQAQWMDMNPDVRVTIEGHTDERGTREYNLALGERRASAAKNYLVSLGISAGRITTISYGKERPVDPESSEAAWAKNRRAVTIVAESR